MENIALYTTHPSFLTEDQLMQLAPNAEIEVHDDGATLSWYGASIRLSVMADDVLAPHLTGFQGFVTKQVGGAADQVQGLLDQIVASQMCIGCVVDPDFDASKDATSFLVSLAATLDGSFFFYGTGIFSPLGEPWFGPSGMPALFELSELSVQKLALEEFPRMTPDQQDRFQRIERVLEQYHVPTSGKRCWVKDRSAEILRRPHEVATRILALHAVVCIARGRPRSEAMKDLEQAGAADALTEAERAFLDHPRLPESERQAMIWQLEDLWVLMWSLRHIDKFSWPAEMCDVDALHELIFNKSKDSRAFIENANLRGAKSILDATQIIIGMHAVLRSAHLEQEEVPENLNWKQPNRMVLVSNSAVGGIVARRHHALNWLRGLGEWDTVDTPTVPEAVL